MTVTSHSLFMIAYVIIASVQMGLGKHYPIHQYPGLMSRLIVRLATVPHGINIPVPQAIMALSPEIPCTKHRGLTVRALHVHPITPPEQPVQSPENPAVARIELPIAISVPEQNLKMPPAWVITPQIVIINHKN